jgi:excisionase family DNA binding protein
VIEEPLLPITVVARRLGVTPRTVRRLLTLRQIPYVQVTATCRRVAPADLDAFIKARTRGRPHDQDTS